MSQVVELRYKDPPQILRRMQRQVQEAGEKKLQKTYRVLNFRIKLHVKRALFGLVLTAFVATGMAIEGFIPLPPGRLTYTVLAEWTLTREWKVPFDAFVCGMAVMFTGHHTFHLLTLEYRKRKIKKQLHAPAAR